MRVEYSRSSSCTSARNACRRATRCASRAFPPVRPVAAGIFSRKGAGATHGIGRDAEPDRRPEQMRHRHHRVGRDARERLGDHGLRGKARVQRETVAARAAHAERLPAGGLIEHVLVAAQQHERLVARRRVLCTASRCEDVVRLETIGDYRRVLRERADRSIQLYRALARAQVSADAHLAGRGGDEPLRAAISRSRVVHQSDVPACLTSEATSI